MCARAKGWWEHNLVKTNPTNNPKTQKNPPLQLNRLAVHSVLPGAICKISPWKQFRAIRLAAH